MYGTTCLCHVQEKWAILLLRFKKLVCEATWQIQHTMVNHQCNRMGFTLILNLMQLSLGGICYRCTQAPVIGYTQDFPLANGWIERQ